MILKKDVKKKKKVITLKITHEWCKIAYTLI